MQSDEQWSLTSPDRLSLGNGTRHTDIFGEVRQSFGGERESFRARLNRHQDVVEALGLRRHVGARFVDRLGETAECPVGLLYDAAQRLDLPPGIAGELPEHLR